MESTRTGIQVAPITNQPVSLLLLPPPLLLLSRVSMKTRIFAVRRPITTLRVTSSAAVGRGVRRRAKHRQPLRHRLRRPDRTDRQEAGLAVATERQNAANCASSRPSRTPSPARRRAVASVPGAWSICERIWPMRRRKFDAGGTAVRTFLETNPCWQSPKLDPSQSLAVRRNWIPVAAIEWAMTTTTGRRCPVWLQQCQRRLPLLKKRRERIKRNSSTLEWHRVM